MAADPGPVTADGPASYPNHRQRRLPSAPPYFFRHSQTVNLPWIIDVVVVCAV